MNGAERLRVLVVDDSAVNRRSISEALSFSKDVEVVGKAADGEEALRLALLLRPDAITLDLEMPRMDGFTFLRILMSRQPTPVVVVSSYSQKENVFKALELGALDFVAKPEKGSATELSSIRSELISKVLSVRSLRPSTLNARPRLESFSKLTVMPAPRVRDLAPPRRVIVIASSTGGPTALIEIFSRLPEDYPSALLVAQHMPEKFTKTFAQRLDKRSTIAVSEADDGAVIGAGFGYICPGRRCMEVEPEGPDRLRVRIREALESDRYVPSADRLFRSAARVFGSRAVGVILTGMGDDGVLGARDIIEAGGTIVAESEETAVIYGMPGSAVRAGVVTRSLPIGKIADYVAGLTE
ncbi:MAG: chemotaxis-specific protein-glutamate methyltransferase CheB [Polyangiaceae bacterium]